MPVIGEPSQGPKLTDYQRIVRRKSALEKDRSSYISHWQDINVNLAPRTGRFMPTDTRNGTKKHNHIHDNTGIRAHGILTAGLMAGATSPSRNWFRITTPDPDLAEFAPVKDWLFQLARLMRLIFLRSNTYRALPQIYQELAGYGTAASVLEPHFDNVIHHHVQTIGEYMLATNDEGVIDTFCRELMMPVGAVVKKFGYENTSRTVKSLWDNFNYDAEVKVIHLVQPRDLSKRDLKKTDNRNMPFESVYLEYGNENENKLLRESGFRRFNVLAPRWETLGLDAYGSNCPGMTTLGDIKELQHDKFQRAKAVDYQSDPPVQVPAAFKNQESDLLPGGVSYVDATGPGAGIRSAFDVPLNLSHLDAGIADTRSRINSGFFADLFLMLLGASRSNITAREVAERHEEKLLMLGPVLESIHGDLLAPKIDTTFDRVIEAQILPPPPQELQNQELKIEFVSLLAQAQKAIGLQGIDRLIGTVGAIAQQQLGAGKAPDVWDKIDTDQVIDTYSDILGVDPDLIIANDEVAIVRQQRQQAQQAQQAQQTAAQGAATAKTLSEVNTEDPSALQGVVQQITGG